jgi:hypothetical protein
MRKRAIFAQSARGAWFAPILRANGDPTVQSGEKTPPRRFSNFSR